MKKITLIMILFTSLFSIKHSIAGDYNLGITIDAGTTSIYKIHKETGVSNLLESTTLLQTLNTDRSYVDSSNGNLIIKGGAPGSGDDVWLSYDIDADTITQITTPDVENVFMFENAWDGKAAEEIITVGTDAKDNSTTTVLGSLDIKDSTGNTLIENKPDGSTHIGENSLVTQEVNGRQELYATNAAGNQIDLNIKSGTNLLIGGRNIMDIISGDISGSVALSSALAALPNSSPDAFYTCGLGTGIHDSSSALSAGCASDFSNYAFADNLPSIFQTASFNIGSSFLMNGEPDISEARDMSIKAGITFKFGSVKPTRVADKQNHMLENKIDAVMAKNDTIQAENDLLKAQIAEINTQLKALNMVAMN